MSKKYKDPQKEASATKNKKIIAWVFLGIACVVLITTILFDIRESSKIDDDLLIKPNVIVVDQSFNKKKLASMTRTAQLYYTYWNTGEDKYLEAAVATSFFNYTLPKSHKQGINGIKNTAINLRKAIPDLHCSIQELVITDNTITARVLFSGTSSGEYLGHPPTGKPVEFMAIDILRIQNEKITQEWHAQNDVFLLQQLNIITFK